MRFYSASLLLLVVSSINTIADAAQHQCKVHPREINLLESLMRETEYVNSMAFITGPNEESPAVMIDGGRGICVDNTSLTFQRQIHDYSCSGRNEFVFRVCVKFDGVSADGPIFFLHSDNKVFLSLEVDTISENNGSIKVSFVHDSKTWAISFPYTFTDLTSWHDISIIFNGRLVSLYVNCEKVADRTVLQPQYCMPDDILLYIGDNPQHTETLQGSLQDLIISFKEKAIAKQCPKAHTDCRYSAAYLSLSSSNNAMVDEYMQLREEVEVLRRNLTMYQAMSRQFACYVDGKQYDFGTFFLKDEETICFCREGGQEKCSKLSDVEKPPVPTAAPQYQSCELKGHMFPVGDLYTEVTKGEKGTTCTARLCQLRVLSDTVQVPWPSPAKHYFCNETLKNCSKSHEWSEVDRNASQCCEFCTACDMQRECGNNSICVNDRASYKCECKDGYILDDGECVDLNECLHGRRPVVGHYCPTDAECVNTAGSFECKCPENHTFIDRNGHTSECEDIDECVVNPNPCPDTFICNNIKGSYQCICPDGYEESKAGDRCIPRCDPPCRPEGECIRTKGDINVCSCPKGLRGEQCQHDINECDDDDTHGCSPLATCINFHGGHFCLCNDGYRGNGNTCDDIDECSEGTAICPGNSECKNTVGSYECECPRGDCKDGCAHPSNDNDVYVNGGKRYKGQRNCTVCTCLNSKWTCSPVECDCSQNPTTPCCSHCNKDICVVNGTEYDHNGDIIYPNPCMKCKCKHGMESCVDNGPSFKCPTDLLRKSPDGCHQCEVEECTAENNGTQVDANSSCSVCTCKDSEWTCIPKVDQCPEVNCKGNTVMSGCCPTCEGSSSSREHNGQIPITPTDDSNHC